MRIDNNNYFETGSSPYYLNQNNTAKDFSLNESTNPEYTLLDVLSKHILVEEHTTIVQPVIAAPQFILINNSIEQQ